MADSVDTLNMSSGASEPIVFVEKPVHYRFTDLEGREFGHWRVLGFVGKNSHSKSLWWCECECGTKKPVVAQSLLEGVSISCGCKARELLSERHTTHGHTKRANKGEPRSAEYRAWRGMKSRCLDPNNQNAKDYSERGISVSQEWIDSFETFFKDMGPRPSSKHSLDRKDNDKGYSKDNCRWATKAEQSRNRRNNVVLEAFGESKLISAWAKEIGIGQSALSSRLQRGWCVDCAVSIKNSGGRCHHIDD